MKNTPKLQKTLLPELLTDNDLLLRIQNIMILNQYQKESAQMIAELDRQYALIDPIEALPQTLMNAGDESLTESIRAKNTLIPGIKNWEIEQKIRITESFNEVAFIDRLKKVGRVLTSIKYRSN